MHYPRTRRDDTGDEHFGKRVPDPYRWLEGDLRLTLDIADWVREQAEFASEYLARLPGRDCFRRRLSELFDHPLVTAPEKRADQYFFTSNPGLDAQPTLRVREGSNGRERTLVDPNLWSKHEALALAEWSVSGDGRHLAFATQLGGSDWRTIQVLDVKRRELLDDELRWARFTKIAWTEDGSGFFYSRFPAPLEDRTFEAPVTDHAIYFHMLGTAQDADRLVYAASGGRLSVESMTVTPDGRYGAISSAPSAEGNALSIIDFNEASWKPRVVAEGANHNWTLIGNIGLQFVLATNKDAAFGKIVTVDLSSGKPHFADLIAERDGATLSEAALLGGRILVTYLVDARSEMRRFRIDGTPDGIIELPGIGTAGDFHGHPDESEAFFVFTSHNVPTTIYRYEVAQRALSPWAGPKVAVELGRIVVEQRFCTSRDGTRVPMFVVRHADRKEPVPTILYGYGGFGISLTPFYSPAALAWVEAGGAYAIANLRGGGEYGKAWHDAGRLGSKQNSFDDFIAAAEYLKSEGIAASDGIAIQGESNGGLLVGAVVNQRPELFAAAIPGVGVMDMLRFDRFTGGQFLVGEYGDPAEEGDFQNLLSYSPCHNVRTGWRYPAILVTTADKDDRVVPAQSFKYVATLQANDLGDRPHIIRIDKGAGHGAGKSMDKALDEMADILAFTAYWTKMSESSGAPAIPDKRPLCSAK